MTKEFYHRIWQYENFEAIKKDFKNKDDVKNFVLLFNKENEKYCFYCGSDDYKIIKLSNYHYCNNCKSYTNFRTGTFFKYILSPLEKVIYIIYLMQYHNLTKRKISKIVDLSDITTRSLIKKINDDIMKNGVLMPTKEFV